MTTSFPLTVYSSPLSMRYPFTVIHKASRLMANGQRTANGQWLTANGATGGSV